MHKSSLGMTVIAGVLVATSSLVVVPAHASGATGPMSRGRSTSTSVKAGAMESSSLVTQREAQKALDVIQAHTSGVDGRFDYAKLERAGVPVSILTEYAGVLEASGQKYAAPSGAQRDINIVASKVAPSVRSFSARTGVSPQSINWGRVLRVAGSYVECMAIRLTVLEWWPFAYCAPDPDHDGTWLVIKY